jgi:hypothetical protein
VTQGSFRAARTRRFRSRPGKFTGIASISACVGERGSAGRYVAGAAGRLRRHAECSTGFVSRTGQPRASFCTVEYTSVVFADAGHVVGLALLFVLREAVVRGV